jgi:hypothetical protein
MDDERALVSRENNSKQQRFIEGHCKPLPRIGLMVAYASCGRLAACAAKVRFGLLLLGAYERSKQRRVREIMTKAGSTRAKVCNGLGVR